MGFAAEVGRVAEFWQAEKRDDVSQAVPIDLGLSERNLL
jgi:hypothetical protein